jgi:hypothetical protein
MGDVMSMNAMTFEADIVGEFLRIPNFERFQNKHVKVVIEEEEQQPVKRLSSLHIDTRGFQFNREEANERVQS